MSALRLINETEITSSVESINITDVFSADFDIYKITASDISTTGTDPTGLDLRFINSSGSVITTNYDYAFLNMQANAVYTEIRATNSDSFDNFVGIADQSPETIGCVAYFFNPYSSNSYTFAIHQISGTNTGSSKNYKGIGVLKQTATISGFQVLTTESRAFNSGFIRTYGLRVDNG